MKIRLENLFSIDIDKDLLEYIVSEGEIDVDILVKSIDSSRLARECLKMIYNSEFRNKIGKYYSLLAKRFEVLCMPESFSQYPEVDLRKIRLDWLLENVYEFLCGRMEESGEFIDEYVLKRGFWFLVPFNTLFLYKGEKIDGRELLKNVIENASLIRRKQITALMLEQYVGMYIAYHESHLLEYSCLEKEIIDYFTLLVKISSLLNRDVKRVGSIYLGKENILPGKKPKIKVGTNLGELFMFHMGNDDLYTAKKFKEILVDVLENTNIDPFEVIQICSPYIFACSDVISGVIPFLKTDKVRRFLKEKEGLWERAFALADIAFFHWELAGEAVEKILHCVASETKKKNFIIGLLSLFLPEELLPKEISPLYLKYRGEIKDLKGRRFLHPLNDSKVFQMSKSFIERLLKSKDLMEDSKYLISKYVKVDKELVKYFNYYWDNLSLAIYQPEASRHLSYDKDLILTYLIEGKRDFDEDFLFDITFRLDNIRVDFFSKSFENCCSLYEALKQRRYKLWECA